MADSDETMSALADIDSKLRELQQQLAQVPAQPSTPSPVQEPHSAPPAPGTQPGPIPHGGSGLGRASSPPPEGRSREDKLLGGAANIAAALERHIRVLANMQAELERSTADLAEQFRIHSGGPSAGSVFQGAITLDVGPFADIGTLGTIEHLLATMTAVEDVHVRSFEGSRALVQMQLDSPVELVEEMRRVLPLDFRATSTSGQHLVIELQG